MRCIQKFGQLSFERSVEPELHFVEIFQLEKRTSFKLLTLKCSHSHRQIFSAPLRSPLVHMLDQQQKSKSFSVE